MSRDALVIGINTYQNLPSLQAPARDSEAIAQTLHTYGEFRVNRIPEVIQSGKPQIGQRTPVSLQELETALVNLFKPKGNNVPQTALFYYSGHGIQKDAGIQEGFLAVSDANPSKGFYGLSLFWLRRLLQESPVRQRIVILDCCHSGELLNFLEADPGAQAGTDRLFMAASKEYETAFESLDSPYSVFTQALLNGLDPTRTDTGVITNHSLTDWVNHALKGEIQQPLFESSGSEIILTRSLAGQACSPKVIKSTDVCPYRGLESFDETHADFFFGREELTAQVLEKVKTDRFVAIAGASGSGKSSLIRAGVIAHLQQEKTALDKEAWRIKLVNPGEHPLKNLADAFIDSELSELERAEQLRRAEAFLQDGGEGLAQLVRASLAMDSNTTVSTGLGTQARPQMLLVIDQLEEVFTLAQGANAEETRQKFFECLTGALTITGDCLSIAVVVRADFLGKCTQYDSFAQQIEQNQITVNPLKYEQIKATIVRPAQKVGLICEPNLVYTMLLDVIGAPGELPLLQYTLLELWHHRKVGAEGGMARLTLDAYRELGGVRGTLEKRATDVFHSLSSEEQAVAKRIFLALTQLGEGTEDTRRRVIKSELVSPVFPIELVEQVLEKLVAAKLVITSQEQETWQAVQSCEIPGTTATVATGAIALQEVVDVVHEALIRNWSLLRDWLTENREMLRRQRKIELAAQEWDSVGQPTSTEYLLQGLRLRDAEDFLRIYPQELSAIAQRYVTVSQVAILRARRGTRQLQIAVPSVLAATLVVAIAQYQGSMHSRTQRDTEIQSATARERAALAQSLLKDSQNDPMVALLISRLAAEGRGSTFETQSSLRAALRSLRLQLELRGHEGAIRQITFSPDRQTLATAGADGTIRLWSINPQTVYNTVLSPSKVLSWAECPTGVACGSSEAQADITAVAFSPNGRQMAAIAQNSPQVKVWSVEAGAVMFPMTSMAAATQVKYSPNGKWIVSTHQDGSIALWRSDTGKLEERLQQGGAIHQVEFSPNGEFLLTTGGDRIAKLWRLMLDKTQTLKVTEVAKMPHDGAVTQASFSPSGRWVATASADGKLRLWDAKTGSLRQTFRQAADASKPSVNPRSIGQNSATVMQSMVRLQFSPDEKTLAAADANHRIQIWEVASGIRQKDLTTMEALPSVTATGGGATVANAPSKPLSFSPDMKLAVTVNALAGRSRHLQEVRLWDMQTGQDIGVLPGHAGTVSALQFSPDGTYVATGSANGVVRFWSTEMGGELPTLKLQNAPVQWAMFTQGQMQGQMQDTVQPKNMPDAGNSASMLAVTPDGKLQRWQIVSDATPTSMMATDVSTRLLSEVKPKNISNFMNWLLNFLQRRDRKLQQEGLPQPELVQEVQASLRGTERGSGRKATVSPITNVFVANRRTTPSSLMFNTVTPTMRQLQSGMRLPTTKAALTGVVVSQNGQWAAIANIEGQVEIHQIQPDQSMILIHRIENWRSTGNPASPLSGVVPRVTAAKKNAANRQGDPVAIRQLTFSPDGQKVLGIADDFTVRLWSVRSGQLVQVLRGHQATVQQARFSADGQFVVTAGIDQTARIWSVGTGEMVRELKHEQGVNAASFSPDGRRVVTASWDGKARVFIVDTEEVQFTLERHRKEVRDVQFSPDGRLIVTAGADGSAFLWDANTSEEQAQLRADGSTAMTQAFFSPDGQYVATLTEDGRIHLWAATWEMLLKLARDRSFRQLTAGECKEYLKLTAEQCPQLPIGSRG